MSGKKNKFRCIEKCSEQCVIKTLSDHYPFMCVYDTSCEVKFEQIETAQKPEEIDKNAKASVVASIEHKGKTYYHTYDFHNCCSCDLKNKKPTIGERSYKISGKCHDLKMGYSTCRGGVWKKVKDGQI